MPFTIVRQVSFRGELVERSFEISADELRIGRGISNDLRLDDLAVSLKQAVIRKDLEQGYVIQDVTQTGGIYLNRIPITEGVLHNGDILRIQHYLISVSQTDSTDSLTLRVTEEARAEVEPSLALLPKFQLSQGRWTKRLLAVSLVVCVLIGTALAWGLGQRSIFMPGSVSVKHAKFSNQCEKCHALWKPVWNLVPNKTCQTCHPAELLTPSHFGERSLAPPPLCASCHLEHKGMVALADVRDSKCVQCHGDLRAKELKVPIVAHVHDFTKTHPEFALSRNVPGKDVLNRIRFDEKPLLKDEGQLKLNHEIHLMPDLKSTIGRETLNCTSCHRIDEAGRYMQPMTFERDCMRCHSLEFDPMLPGKSVIHGRQPAEVHQELEEIYAAFYLRAHPEEAKKPEGTRRLPGQPPTAKEIFVEDRRTRAERILFPPKGKKCAKCHSMEITQSESGSNSDNSAPAKDSQESFAKILLDKSQANSLLRRTVLTVLPTGIPKRWLPYSRFDHDAHKGLPDFRSKQTWCLACHESAATSKKTEDVLLPSIGLCRSCHFEPGGAQASCKACHEFHEKKKEPQFPAQKTAVTDSDPASR